MKVLIFLILLAGTAQGTTYAVLQSGSYNGLLSGGFGILHSNWNFESTVGWTPNPGGEATLQLNLKGYKMLSQRIYGGLGLLITDDDDTFVHLPDKYPKNYYSPTGYHFAPFVGWTEDGFFVEFTTIDYYLEVKARNPNYIDWKDMVSAGFGYGWEL